MRSSYFTIQSWMVTDLNLKGAERDVYAIIHGFCQDGESDFHGSLSYLSKMTGYSKNSICSALQSLVEKGYIEKTEKIINGIKFCRYHTSYLYTIQENCTENTSKNEKSVQVTLTNNISKLINKDNKIKNNKDNTQKVEEIKDLYNLHCNNLPKIYKLTDKRKKAIGSLLKKYSVEEITQVFDIANESDFLMGKNDRGWKADLDFILREDKFINILEGKYGGHRKINRVSSDMGRTANRMTDDQKKQLKEDIKNDRAEKY